MMKNKVIRRTIEVPMEDNRPIAQNTLVNEIDRCCLRIAQDAEKVQEISEKLFLESGIPMRITADVLTGRKSSNGLNRFILYKLFRNVSANRPELYFTEPEIKEFDNMRFEVGKVKFPLRIPALKVADDQYISSFSSKDLMGLRDAQLINYNKNTQRSVTLKTTNSGEMVFSITLDKAAVASIEASFADGSYIPTTITLNIPEDADFIYDEKEKALVIRELKNFDIIDGYHRYIALSNRHNVDQDFNYPMELRIVCFPEYKARQFIYQEDQKTKMTAIDSKAYNQNDPGNIVCTKLNTDPTSNICGLISKEKLIDPALCGLIISQLFFDRRASRADIIRATREIRDKFNQLTENDSKYLEERYTAQRLAAVLYAFAKGKEDKLRQLEEVANTFTKSRLINKYGISRKTINSFDAV